MKIIGFVHTGEGYQMVLKGDSCLLVNRKPFFVPDWSKDVRMVPCTVLRVSRLGKEIHPKFAHRYYDAVAHGIDFVAWDVLEHAKQKGQSWTNALAFDYSLAVGEWKENNDNNNDNFAKAIAEVSKVMTIRQGDLIYIQAPIPAAPVQRNQVIEDDGLYCKIK